MGKKGKFNGKQAKQVRTWGRRCLLHQRKGSQETKGQCGWRSSASPGPNAWQSLTLDLQTPRPKGRDFRKDFPPSSPPSE